VVPPRAVGAEDVLSASADPPGERRTAVLVDPHPLWTDALPPVLLRAGVITVATANSSVRALALVEQHRPSVLVTSLEMPDNEMDGLRLIETVVERFADLRVVVFSRYEDLRRIEAALNAGALAYVTKAAHPDDVAAAVRQAFAHSIFLAEDRVIRTAGARRTFVNSSGLTRRELEILELLAGGRSNAQLARALWVTEQTVKFHLSNVYKKLGVANRWEASQWAAAHGLGP
jgi:DNA-binding NarL/FixJ family response regulator